MPQAPLFERIALIGIGLIGSSLARVARREGLARHIVACARTAESLAKARALGLADSYSTDPAAVADALNRARSPFNVTAPSLAAGEAALADAGHMQAARRHNDHWLPWLAGELAGLGLTVHPSVTNFVLIRFPDEPDRNAGAANAHLMRRGIIPRTLDAYHLPECLRMSVGLEEDMRAAVAALAEFMG